MTREIQVTVDQIPCLVIVSDESQALLEAKAAGRAIIAVEEDGRTLPAAPYVVPNWEDVSLELAELVARRHLGLPWTIGEGQRIVVRELVERDRMDIPAEEKLSREEEMFRQEEGIRTYIKGQYPFWEFGVWALVRASDRRLVGLGGMTAPRLPWEFGEDLENYRKQVQRQNGWDVLELGYRIFAPYRRQGLGREACSLILSYCHEVLRCRACALIEEKNQASRCLAEGLGMECLSVRKTGTLSPERLLLFAEKC